MQKMLYGPNSLKTWEQLFCTSDPALGNYSWKEVWYNSIVQQYSTMALTISTDKLIALSGVAKYFMARFEDTYIAGMWRRHLELDMCWYIYAPRPRPTPYRSPSWSWASADGPIGPSIIHPEIGDGITYVEDVVLSHATDDTSGAVTDGWLDLCGRLKPMRLYEKRDEGRVEWRMVIDNLVISGPPGIIQGNDLKHFYAYLDVLPGDASTLNSHNAQGRYFFMPCVITQKDGGGFVGSLLLKLVDKEKVLFERIGFSFASIPGNIERLLADLDEEIKARLPCLRYEDGLHTIRII